MVGFTNHVAYQSFDRGAYIGHRGDLYLNLFFPLKGKII